jgi:uncharacterized protein YtpQ (UPF0354 family)
MPLTTEDINQIKQALQPSFDSVEARIATKADLSSLEERMASKIDLASAVGRLTAKIEEQGQEVIDDISEQMQTGFTAISGSFDKLERRIDNLRIVSRP